MNLKARLAAVNLMRAALATVVVVSASGCAIVSGAEHGPNGGGAVYFIDGMSAGTAYRKADAKCPNGYSIISGAQQTSVIDYVMTIQCNPAQPASAKAQSAPVPAVAATNVQRAPREADAMNTELRRLARDSQAHGDSKAAKEYLDMIVPASSQH